MLQAYKENLKYFYKYEFTVFRSLCALEPSSGLSGVKRLIHETCYYLLLFYVMGYNFGLIVGLFYQPTILDKLQNVIFVLSSMVASTAKLHLMKKNSTLYHDQVKSLQKDVFDPKESVEFALLNQKISASKRFQLCYGGITFVALMYILLSKKITHPDELPAAVFLPFEITTKFEFMVMELHGFISISTMCFMNTAYDIWLMSLLMFAYGQLELLEHRLRGIGKDAESDWAVSAELKMCACHHVEICKFVESLERVISLPASIQVMCTLLVLSCNFYALAFISFEEDLATFVKFFLYQLTMLAQIFLICFYSNEVTLAGDRLAFALYSADWTTWSRVNKKLLLLGILRFQRSIAVRPINRCYCFDLTTFSAIVNSSYSYFALLKQMNN